MTKYIGKEISRVDGFAKVTGQAKYAAEFFLPKMVYGFIVQGTIAKGEITSIDTKKAENVSGVIKVFTHENTPKIPVAENGRIMGSESFNPLQSGKIHFNAQPIALVIAETFEQARFAARLVKATYKEEKSTTSVLTNLANATPLGEGRTPKPRGNPGKAFADAAVKIEAEYTIPIEHHNPMEPHGATAVWQGNKLTIFDKSQNVFGVRTHLASIFGVPEDDVNLLSLFVGGGFGSSLRANYYPYLVAMAARELNLPVRLIYTRRQMFTGHGYRPFTWQKVSLGADRTGKLQAIIHDSANNTSTLEDRFEGTNRWTRRIYACENVDTPGKFVKTDLPSPAAMRAPGAVSGMFALESALDELSYELKIDPLELRLINYAEVDPEDGKPWSSKALRECYSEGAAKFGWEKRKPEPRSMREGRWLVGYGMATGVWGGFQSPAGAKIVLRADGTANVASGTTDIGVGTYTVMTQIAAELLGIQQKNVKAELGDTKFPRAPSQGGSQTTASVGAAIYGAVLNIKQKLLELASKEPDNVFASAANDDVELMDGNLRLKSDPSKSVSVSGLMRKNNLTEIIEEHRVVPSPERDKYSIAAHGAQFVEVKVDEDLGIIKVTRVVESTATGRIINPKTSHSQEIGGVVWGIGMALHENTEVDHRFGRMTTTNLAEYHVPTNADIHQVDTMFVEEDDKIVNPLGIKGMGELGMVGIPAAIANAIFHATGKRVRDLPITPDKLL